MLLHTSVAAQTVSASLLMLVYNALPRTSFSLQHLSDLLAHTALPCVWHEVVHFHIFYFISYFIDL